ncbi:MAG: electron transfer flavoprotein subunit beta/FixA family protein [Bdellovibrionales bacterium]|nr:electron transfer flavoprotein subunit beta/FixA family protein [Bdellovibrionales bacterium]
MKIYVCIKQVPDTETKIRLKADNSSIDDSAIKWVMNPYDEYAVEEALKVKAEVPDSTVTVVSLGPKKRVVDSIRTALAMGADDGLVIDAPENLDGYLTAKGLAAAIKGEGNPDLVLTGKLAIDDNNAYVSQALAEFLGIPHATVISKMAREDGKITVEREIEGGSREVIQLVGPSLVAANKGLNTPRYASLPGIMKAKKKPLKELDLAGLGVSPGDERIGFKDFQMPPEKPATKLIDGDAGQQASELVRLLREEAKVL